MAITSAHYDKAAELLVAHQPDATTHSEAYWEGYLDAVAWALAGKPQTQSSDNRYTLGTSQRDAWCYGWMSRQAFAEKHLGNRQ